MAHKGEIIQGPWPETEANVEYDGSEMATETADEEYLMLFEALEEWFESGTFQAVPCDRHELMRHVVEYAWL